MGVWVVFSAIVVCGRFRLVDVSVGGSLGEYFSGNAMYEWQKVRFRQRRHCKKCVKKGMLIDKRLSINKEPFNDEPFEP